MRYVMPNSYQTKHTETKPKLNANNYYKKINNFVTPAPLTSLFLGLDDTKIERKRRELMIRLELQQAQALLRASTLQ